MKRNASREAEATYADGISAQRCLFCGSVLSWASGARAVTLRLADVELVLQAFQEAVPVEVRPPWCAELIQRLAQAVGRPVEELKS